MKNKKVTALIRFIPNLLTLINLSVGVVGIILAFSPYMEYAGFCILFASVFDYFDGFAARLLNAQSEIGKQLDSLADAVAFGVLPGIIMYQLLLMSQGAYFVPFHERDVVVHSISLLALLIPACSVFRLAKFNVDTEQTVNFRGLPTPAMAIFVGALPIILGEQLDFNYYLPLDEVSLANQIEYRYWDEFDVFVASALQSSWVLLILIVALSSLMVSNFTILSLKLNGFSWKENQWKYTILGLAALTLLLSFLPNWIWVPGYPFVEWVAFPLIITELVFLSFLKKVLNK
ncbi:MAG: CDP-alcohol phosphatidyltransferase family protein [Flavobacteriales bacterium]|nr:CDP-alcohol phosphatidyltransferase family protein [Flavobacteriales bacterium]